MMVSLSGDGASLVFLSSELGLWIWRRAGLTVEGETKDWQCVSDLLPAISGSGSGPVMEAVESGRSDSKHDSHSHEKTPGLYWNNSHIYGISVYY